MGFAVSGVLLLAVSTVIELSDISPRTELGTGIAAGTVFLLAMACSRGADSDVLALRARLKRTLIATLPMHLPASSLTIPSHSQYSNLLTRPLAS